MKEKGVIQSITACLLLSKIASCVAMQLLGFVAISEIFVGGATLIDKMLGAFTSR